MAKQFAWSYSKLKNFETCPKRYYEVDVAKSYKDEPSEAILWGNQVHEALATSIDKRTPLPLEMSDFQPFVNEIVTSADGLGAKIVVEQKYAITRDLQPTTWFGHNVWYRGIADVVIRSGAVAIALDWKTGKVLNDHSQLMLMGQCLFSHFPELQKVRTSYIWLKEDAKSTDNYTRQDIANDWVGLLPRVEALENAHKTQSFPPKPSYLCRSYCPVQSCVHHGKGVRR